MTASTNGLPAGRALGASLARLSAGAMDTTRAERLLQFACLSTLGLVLVIEWIITAQQVSGGVRTDFFRYMDATHRFLAGGGFYSASQLAGPHVTTTEDAMYPPVTLGLLVPFALIPQPLSMVMWYAIPIAVLVGMLVAARPVGWPLVAIAACLTMPQTRDMLVLGNPGLWMAAFVGLATRWPAFGALLLMKPSVIPFAFVGVRRRSWWVAAGVVVIASLALLPMTLDWLRVVLNARGPYSGFLYGLNNVPLLLVPLIARWGSRHNPSRPWLRRPTSVGVDVVVESRHGLPMSSGWTLWAGRRSRG